jgi:hypothetical protein
VPTKSVSTDRNRYPTRAPLAADLVVPLDVLANPRGLTVVRTGSVLGRDAVLVRTTFDRAAPMFPFFEIGGSWRPFFRDDRVEMWVDSDDWSPLRWTVYPADDPARAEWSLLFGRDPEPPDLPIFDVAAVATDHDAPSPSRFRPAPADPPIDVSRLPADVGFRPVTPTATQGLALTDVAALDGGGAPPRSLLIYSSGLTYLRIIERRHSTGPGMFGAISESAERVAIGAGVGYYEPADGTQARRLAIRSPDTSLFLETNLSREDLLAVAASLPLRGRA